MIYNKGVNDMNVTLILYESRYTIGEKVAKMISPILGPAKAFNIEYPPENIKYYSNIVFVFSLYGHDSSKKTIDYIEKNSIDLSKVKAGIVCIGLDKQDGLKKINEFKTKINKQNTYDCFIKEQLVIDEVNQLSKNLREYFNTPNFIPPTNTTKAEIEKFIKSKNTCTLSTGYGDFVRATPIEYEYYDGRFYIISEGGLKFIGIYQNNKVSICIYENYTDMNNLKGLQVTGTVELLEPWSDEYLDVLERKNLKLQNISKLPFDMNILKIKPNKYEFLYSKFKNLGYDPKQIFIPKD